MSDGDVSELVVKGQRRLRETPWAPFPSHPETDPVGPPLENPEIGPEEGQPSPCDDPDKKREWDTDAAAAAARKEFIQKAAKAKESSVAYRERTAVLYRNDQGGVSVGQIGTGPPMSGSAPWEWFTQSGEAITGDRVVGMIHLHPGSNSPSAPDWQSFETFGNWIEQSGGNPDNLRIYIVGMPHPPSPITVFSLAQRDAGTEVNPDGQPC